MRALVLFLIAAGCTPGAGSTDRLIAEDASTRPDGAIARSDPPAGLAYAKNPLMLTRATPISPDAPSSTGGHITSYTVVPTLPEGLTLDAATGVIAGAPTSVAAAATYVVTGSNEAGATTASLSIEILPKPPSAITYPTSPASYERTLPIVPNVPTAAGDAIDAWSVSPALPTGLGIDTATGAISGTPLVASSGAYTVTATNAGGSASVQLVVSITPVPPSALTYATNPASYVKDVAIAPNAPSSSGDPATSYAVAPPLPAGLALAASTGIVSGTPTVVTSPTSYVVTARNEGGSTTSSLVIDVEDQPPKSVTYPQAYAVYDLGHAVTGDPPVITGGTPLAYAVSPTLPAGLTLSSSTGILSGTPTSTVAPASFTVTASNHLGSASTTIQIGVFDFDAQRFIAIPQNMSGYTQLGSLGIDAVRYDGTSIIAGTNAGLSFSSDGGATWTTRTTFDGLPSYSVTSLELVSGGLLVGTAAGGAFTTDYTHYTSMPDLVGKAVSRLVSDGTRTYAAVGATLYISTDAGATFPVSMPAGSTIFDLSATATRLCIATEGNGVLLSVDGGHSFVTRTPANGLGDMFVRGVYCQPGTDLVLAATEGGLSSSTDGGATFVTTQNGLCATPRHVYVDGGTIYEVDDAGLAISTNGGTSFTCAFETVSQRDVYAVGAQIFASGDDGLHLSADHGAHFTSYATTEGPGYPGFRALVVAGASIDIGGYGLSRSTDSGTTFSPVANPGGIGVNINAIARNAALVVAGSDAGLFVSTDGGSTYAQRTTTDGLGNDDVPNVAITTTDVYAATDLGLGVSTNGGVSFANRTTSSGLPDNRVLDVAAGNGVVVAATNAGVALSTDHGATFVARTTAQGLSSNDSRAATVAPNGDLYVGHDNGTLSRSTDGGTTFTVLKRGLSGSVTSVSVVDASIAVGTIDGLFLSLDGGNDFWPVTSHENATVSRVALDSGYLYSTSFSYFGPGSAVRSQHTLSAAAP